MFGGNIRLTDHIHNHQMGNVLSFAGCANSSEELPYTAPLSRSTAISVSKHLCRVSVGVARLEPRETSPSSPTTTSFTSASSSTSSQQATTQPLADRTWTEGVVALGPSPSGSLTIRRSDKAFPNSVGEDNGIKCIELLYRVPAGIQRQVLRWFCPAVTTCVRWIHQRLRRSDESASLVNLVRSLSIFPIRSTTLRLDGPTQLGLPTLPTCPTTKWGVPCCGA